MLACKQTISTAKEGAPFSAHRGSFSLGNFLEVHRVTRFAAGFSRSEIADGTKGRAETRKKLENAFTTDAVLIGQRCHGGCLVGAPNYCQRSRLFTRESDIHRFDVTTITRSESETNCKSIPHYRGYVTFIYGLIELPSTYGSRGFFESGKLLPVIPTPIYPRGCNENPTR